MMVLISLFLYRNREVFHGLQNNPWIWFLVILANFAVMLARAGVFYYQVAMNGGEISFLKSLCDVSNTTILNSFLPSSTGSFYLVNEFKKLTNSDYLHSLAAQVLSVLFILWWASVYTVIGLGALTTELLPEKIHNVLVIFVVVAPGVVIGITKLGIKIKLPYFKVQLDVVIRPLLSKRGMAYFVCTFWESFALMLTVYTGFLLLGVNINILNSGLISGVRNLSLFFAFTPGALGSSEAVLFLIAKPLGIVGTLIVALSIFLRAATLVSAALVLLLSAKKKFLKKVSSRC